MKRKILKVTAGILFMPIVYLILAFGINEIKNNNLDDKKASQKFNIKKSDQNIDFSKAQKLKLPVKEEKYKNRYFNDSDKLSTLLLARRITYEIPYPDTKTNFGFCYNKTSGELMEEGGRTVLFNKKTDNPYRKLICSGIIENLQHSDLKATIFDRRSWYLKPNVKADVADLPDRTPIFDIVSVNYKGEEILEYKFTIDAFNFKKNNSIQAEYTDKFYNLNIPLSMIVCGDETEKGLNNGRGKASNNLNNCKVDFRIYWYGTADFWFDKLTVDDYYANSMLNQIPDFNYDEKINDELVRLTELPDSVQKPICIEEIAYSQLPCVDYLLGKIANFNITNNKNIKYFIRKSSWTYTGLRNNIYQEYSYK